MTPRPPRGADWVLRSFVPKDDRDAVRGDLEEVFHERIRSRGHASARGWFWIQTVSFSLRFSAERCREALFSMSRNALPSLLDIKLGARMLVKSPLLTVTGCVAIATAIGINAGFNEFTGDLMSVAADVRSDDRVVGIANYDIEDDRRDPRVLEDLGRWRDELETVESIGAAVLLDMGLLGPGGQPIPVNVAEMSASGFTVAGMVPELGRPLLETDDGPGAEPVMVVGHDAWQRYLGGDPDVVGSTVRIGETTYRVVGVAPPDFRFPTAQDVWVNFRRDLDSYPPRAGPAVLAFGRLASGRSLDEAEREIEQLGLRAAAEYPETHARLRPSVVPFGSGLDAAEIRWALRMARTILVMLLLVACANIATLVFARNAGREAEIAVRHALGAGRARIVSQLFAEAVVLAVVSAGVGLFVAEWGLRYGGKVFWEVQRMDPPLWWDPGMSPSTVLYSLGLAVLGAAVVGILPALRATGRAHATLQRAGSGAGTLAFGRLPTAVIVVQIAIAVALFPIVLETTIADFQKKLITVSFPTEGYLTARILVDSEVQISSSAADQAAGREGRIISVAGVTDGFRTGPALLARYKEMRDNVGERLRNEPGVRSVAFTSRLPGLVGQSIPATRLEVDGQPPRDRGWRVLTVTADLELFDVVGTSTLAGRPFSVADYGPDQHVALVNQALVDELFEGRNPVGTLVRDFEVEGDPGRPWTEIVGVVPDEAAGPGAANSQIYYPLAGVGEYPMRMLIEVEGDPAVFSPRLRTLIAGSEPGLIMDEVLTLGELRRSEMLSDLFFVVLLGFVALVTALLATAGVYALMSFIVSQRTREIGIRTALGAAPLRVLKGVFLRTFVQLGFGVAIGLLVVGVVGTKALGFDGGSRLWLAGAGVSAVLITVGLVGCTIPVLRALRIQPTEALSADG